MGCVEAVHLWGASGARGGAVPRGRGVVCGVWIAGVAAPAGEQDRPADDADRAAVLASSLLGRVDSSLATTVALAVENWWIIVFVVSRSFQLTGTAGGRATRCYLPPWSRRWRSSHWSGCSSSTCRAICCWSGRSPPWRSALASSTVCWGLPQRSVWQLWCLPGGWRRLERSGGRPSPALVGSLTFVTLAGLVLQGVFTTAQSPFLVWPTLIGLLFVPVVFLFGVLRSWLARAAVADLLVELEGGHGRPLQEPLRTRSVIRAFDHRLLAARVWVLCGR